MRQIGVVGLALATIAMWGCGKDGPGPARYIEIELSSQATDAYVGAPFEAVRVIFTLTDEEHNIVTYLSTADILTCSINDPGATVNLAGYPDDVTIENLRSTGTFKVRCSLRDGQGIEMDRDDELLTVFDVSPPTPVTVSSPAPDTSFGAGQDIDVEVSAEDVVGLVRLQARLEGPTDDLDSVLLGSLPQSASATLTVSVPDGFSQFATATLYGLAEDTAGNLGVVPLGVPLNLSPVTLFDPGYTPELFAESASFVDPEALACNVVAAGQVEFWVADPGADQIFYVSPDGITTPFLGVAAPRGIAYDAATTNLYITQDSGQVIEVPAANAAMASNLLVVPFNTQARHILAGGPDSETVNPGEALLFAALENNNEVRWVQPSTGVQDVFEDVGTDGPWGVAYRPVTGHLYYSNENADEIISTTRDGADANTTADQIQAYETSGILDRPRGLTVVPEGAGLTHEGDLFIANFGNRRILRAEDSNGDGVAEDTVEFARISTDTPPTDVAFCDGALYVLTQSNQGDVDPRIIRISGF